jgi:hypothetical protein
MCCNVIATYVVYWPLLVTIGILLALALLFIYLLRRTLDANISRTRFGFFIERELFPADEEGSPRNGMTKSWDTLELPPEKEK